ncbi:MAG: Hpt domain-containing protein [Thiohalocapsa sp.]|jgi:HPt (histidine-containing phosphotransfer) domain-containing protein
MPQSDDVQDLPIWNQAEAVASVGDPSLARQLLAQLCADLPDTLADLRRLHTAGDLTAAAERGHQISGAAAYCGVMALRAALRAFEQQARAGDDAGTAAALDAVDAAAYQLLAHARTLD